MSETRRERLEAEMKEAGWREREEELAELAQTETQEEKNQ